MSTDDQDPTADGPQRDQLVAWLRADASHALRSLSGALEHQPADSDELQGRIRDILNGLGPMRRWADALAGEGTLTAGGVPSVMARMRLEGEGTLSAGVVIRPPAAVIELVVLPGNVAISGPPVQAHVHHLSGEAHGTSAATGTVVVRREGEQANAATLDDVPALVQRVVELLEGMPKDSKRLNWGDSYDRIMAAATFIVALLALLRQLGVGSP